MASPSPRLVLVGLFFLCSTPGLFAQHAHHESADGEPTLSFGWGVHAVGLLTHAAPAVFGRSLTEAYLSQPSLSVDVARGDRVRFDGLLNLEGLTLHRGELNAGTWGEGYIDRRHPHTYLHEVMLTVRLAGAAGARRHLTAAAGRGFVPFGTDDPMVRPLVKYPANHHLAQILERLVAVVAVRDGPLILEGALFNGDEPASPSDLGTISRFGDSWSVRLTAAPVEGLEASVSRAHVASPEFPPGSGLDHRKSAASLRFERRMGSGPRYVLVEWALTDEYSGGRRTFRFPTALAEAAVTHGSASLGLRVERTVRPEEERLLDPFRSPRPHADAHILGRTRWWILSGRVDRRFRAPGNVWLTPFAELSWQQPRATTQPTVFEPSEFYGSASLWSISAGVRIGAGARHVRMGRYGAAIADFHEHPTVRSHENGTAERVSTSSAAHPGSS